MAGTGTNIPLRAKRGIAVEWGEFLAIPMNPVMGMWSFVPGQEVPVGGSPDMQNMVVRGSILMKRPGYVEFPTGMASLGSAVIGLYSTQNDENSTYLYASTLTQIYVQAPGSAVWALVSGPVLNGTAERMVQWETSQNSVVFSQGIDQVMKIVFGGTYAILNANCPPASYLTRFADRLFLARTVETALTRPYRVRRCVASDHTDWTGVGSGFHDLTEFPYHIKGMKKLASQNVVYTEKSINIGTRTETPDAPVRWEPVVTDVGLYAPYTLRGRNEYHFFLGNDDLYLFDGHTVGSIGWQIRDLLYPILNINKLHMMFGEVLFDTQEYLVFACHGSEATAQHVYCYNWSRQIWTPWLIPAGHQSCCIHRMDVGITIDSVNTPIDSNTYEIDAQASQEAYPALLTGNADGKVYRWTKGTLSDNGEEINAYWCSKDFTSKDVGGRQDEQIVLREIYVRYKETGAACTMVVYYSLNGGASWLDYGNLAFVAGTSGYNMAVCHRQVTGNHIRFKLANSTTNEDWNILEIIPVFEKPTSKVAA